MALTPEQRISLIRAYTPILFFHPEERFMPVRPELFLQGSALWRGDQTGKKDGWGLGGPAFPRRPLIPRGGISLKPSEDFEGQKDPDGDGVGEWYLGHNDTQKQIDPYLRSIDAEELWLDCAGWRDGDEVSATSTNEACDLDKLAARFTNDPSSPIPTQPWYYAEVMEIEEFDKFFVGLTTEPLDAQELLREQFGDVWVIWYYFLYPGHEEFLRRCEAFFDKKSDGDYEGDWNAVGVLVKRPATLPWETPQPTFPEPSRVGYGVRLRGLAKDVSETFFRQGMTIRDWHDEVEKSGLHPRVYVSRGYHNNYSTAGTQPPTEATLGSIAIGSLACGVGEGAAAIGSEIKDAVADAGDVAGDVALTLAKMLAGAEIGFALGPLGALGGAVGGLVAGIVEANASSADHEPSADDWRQREEEHAPLPGKYGLVVAPADVPNPLETKNPDPARNETAVSLIHWPGLDQDKLVDRATQLWWGKDEQFRGYRGRWGVRVQNDPMLRRSGIEFPDFRRSFLRGLIEAAIKG
jgi:hypothetical protein